MPCYHPSRVPIRRKSIFAGRRVEYTQEVPCGHCLGCRAEQARQWAVRMMHESIMHESSWFATLTYSDEEIPPNGSLRPSDLQSFFKNLRRDLPPRSVSFYACGEYGEYTERPHYHAVLFGVEFLDKYRDPNPSRDTVWRSPSLERAWGRGITELGTLTMASASYVAGYVRKKVRKKDFENHYTRVDDETGELFELEPEFARMSLRPAIGRRWIERYWRDVYPRDYVVVDGVECKPPRYYDKWMDANHPEIMEGVRQRRWDEMVELDKYTLSAKESIHEARTALFSGRSGI